jgi:hypothetical protein
LRPATSTEEFPLQLIRYNQVWVIYDGSPPAFVRSHRSGRIVTLMFVALAIAMAQRPGQAQAPDALRYSKSYTLTGNYIVRAVDLSPARAINGFVTDTIPMSGVPGAFLYCKTIATQTSQNSRGCARPHTSHDRSTKLLASPSVLQQDPAGYSPVGLTLPGVRSRNRRR